MDVHNGHHLYVNATHCRQGDIVPKSTVPIRSPVFPRSRIYYRLFTLTRTLLGIFDRSQELQSSPGLVLRPPLAVVPFNLPRRPRSRMD